MYDFGKRHGTNALSSYAGTRQGRSFRRGSVAVTAALLLGLVAVARAAAQDEVDYHNGGSIMEYASLLGGFGVKARLIFWRPPKYYNFVPGGGPADTLFEDTIKQFFRDLGASTGLSRKDGYLDVAAQYKGPCNGDTAPFPGGCSPGPVNAVDWWDDMTPFPPQFLSVYPLSDADIQKSIQRAIQTKGWKSGIDTEFFVFLPYGVDVCDSKGNCSNKGMCAYHSSFSLDQNNPTVIYAVLPQVHSLWESYHSCGLNFDTFPEDGVNAFESPKNYSKPWTTPNQLDADWEIVGVSHELLESLTDPQGKAWYQSMNCGWGGQSCGDEIGDMCASMAGGVSSRSGGNLRLSNNGELFDEYLVQQVWSNAAQSCVLGSSVLMTIHTGAVRGPDPVQGCNGSIIKATLYDPDGRKVEEVLLKRGNDPGWDDNAYTYTPWGGKVRAFYYPADSGLGSVSIELVQQSCGVQSPDNWRIYGIDLQAFTASGKQICSHSYPFWNEWLTGGHPTLPLQTPGC